MTKIYITATLVLIAWLTLIGFVFGTTDIITASFIYICGCILMSVGAKMGEMAERLDIKSKSDIL